MQSDAEMMRFGPFELDPVSGELHRLGLRVKIRPPASRVLAFLINRSGQIVTREELQHHLRPDGTFVNFEHSLNFCIREIRRALGEHSEKPHYLETIPRRGYRFTASKENKIQSLAVLPFHNSDEDLDLDYLADAITAGLIRRTSQLPKLQVIARTTMFRFKGRRLRPEGVGRRLGIGAVLAGHVLQRGDRLFIGVDLIDVHSGLQLWGEQYERPAGDVVHMQLLRALLVLGSLP